MRKGEEKRQELLQTAEKLFCQNGYEATSIQDILDATKLSKGGFYHHFAGKDALLSALCARHAESAAAEAAEALAQAGDPLARINAVLHAYVPIRREEAEYMAMLLPYLQKAEARAVALTFQDALLEHFLPLLRQEVEAAHKAEAVHPQAAGMEHAVLHLVNCCWMDAAEHLRQAIAAERCCETPVLLNILERYRRAVEAILDAPYGSMEIIRVEEWDAVLEKIRRAAH